MMLGLSPGCITWMNAVPPYAIYRSDLDFFEFMAENELHVERPLTLGIDVCMPFEEGKPAIGFHLWGGASCVTEGISNAEFPRTLGEYVTALRAVFRERFSIHDIFGAHAETLDLLVATHANLPVIVAGWPPEH